MNTVIQLFLVWDEIIHGLRKYGLDREKVVKYMCIYNENWILMFEILWSMLLQVDTRIVNKYYPRPRYFPYPWVT